MHDVSGSGGGLHPFDGFYVLDVWRRVGPQFFQVLEAVWMLQIAHPCGCKSPESPPCDVGMPGRVAACCGRLCKCVPSSTLWEVVASSRKTGQPMPTGGRTAMLTSTRCCRLLPVRMRTGVLEGRWAVCSPAPGCAACRRRRYAEMAPSHPCHRLGPVVPCGLALVVNPGGGTAAPRASWLQPCGPNNFPTAAQFPREANSLAFGSSTALRPLRDAARPTPTGRITDKAAVGDLAPPETE